MRFAAVLALLLLTGCGAPKKPAKNGVTLILEPHCLTKPIVVENCDPKSDPMKCAGPAKFDYTKGCETVQIPKEKTQ